MNQYRCDNRCKYFDNSDETNHCFGLIFCTKHQMLVEPIFQEESKTLGCASHSDFQSERDKVLDNLIEKLNNRSAEHHLFMELLESKEETNIELWRIQDQRLYALDEVYKWVEELRQKVGEP